VEHDRLADLLGPSASGAGVLGGDGDLSRALERWAADAAVDEAARQRARQRWLRIQAEEEATVAGVLLDLAERGTTVSLDVGPHRLRGRIVGLGDDFVAARSETDQEVLVPSDAIEVVRSEPGAPDVVGDRAALLDVTLANVLVPLAAERPEVAIRTRSGTVVRGELRSAGTDVARLRVAGEPPTSAWVPVTAIQLLILEP
jgi:hypothetical protein